MPSGTGSQQERERSEQDQALRAAEALLRNARVRRTLEFEGNTDIPEEALVERSSTADPIALRFHHNFRTPQGRIMADQTRVNNPNIRAVAPAPAQTQPVLDSGG